MEEENNPGFYKSDRSINPEFVLSVEEINKNSQRAEEQQPPSNPYQLSSDEIPKPTQRRPSSHSIRKYHGSRDVAAEEEPQLVLKKVPSIRSIRSYHSHREPVDGFENGGDDDDGVLKKVPSMQSVHSQKSHQSHRSNKSNRDQKSIAASAANSMADSEDSGAGKQITDTGVRKLMFMKWVFISTILHVCYIVFLSLLHSKDGWFLPFDPYTFKYAGPLALQTLALVCYVANDIALTDAMSGFAGYLMTRKEGYSIAICGFVHGSIADKLRYAGRLSFRSTAKNFLSKISLIWLFHSMLLVLTLIASTAITTSGSRVLGKKLMCLQYSQDQKPIDRGLPTLANEMGVAELMDGTALGHLSTNAGKKDGSTKYSEHILPPQLTEDCKDGSYIFGHGFITDVLSKCTCAASSSRADLIAAGVNSTQATEVSNYLVANAGISGMVTALNMPVYDAINLTVILSGTNLCGGINLTHPAVPVCHTKIWDHRDGTMYVTYKADVFMSSIVQQKSEMVYTDHLSDLPYLHTSLKILLGNVGWTNLPAHWPGAVNPMLWLMTKNMQAVSSGLLETGMEVTVMYILRAAMQRSYTIYGGLCQETITDPGSVTLFLSDMGFATGFIWVAFQLIVNLVSLAAYVPWMISEFPMLPAILIANDNLLFSFLAAKNFIMSSRIKSMGSNLESALIWPRLDVVLRVGESALSAEDPERGVIVLDKPRMVTNLSYVKAYV